PRGQSGLNCDLRMAAPRHHDRSRGPRRGDPGRLSWSRSERVFASRTGVGMRDKVVADVAAALDGIPDGATVLIGGFGLAGQPIALIDGLLEQGAKDLTIVSNNAGNGDTGIAALLAAGRVRKVVC